MTGSGSDGIGMGSSFHFHTGEDPTRRPAGSEPGQPRLDAPRPAGGELRPAPFRMLVLADLRGLPAERTPPRRAVVRRGALDEALAALEPALFFTVADLLGGDSKGLEVRLAPRALRDLDPERVAGALPAFDLPLKLARELDALGHGAMSAAQFRSGLGVYDGVAALAEPLRLVERALAAGGAPASAAPAPPPPAGAASSGDATLDAIFSLVDAGPGGASPDGSAAGGAPGSGDGDEPAGGAARPGDATSGATSGAISGAIAAIGGRSGSAKVDVGPAATALRAVLDRQLAAVFADPQLRRVEAAWRGLRWLLESCPPGAPVEVEVVDAAPGEVADVLHTHVLPLERAGSERAPLALLLVERAFANTSADLAALERLGVVADELQAPAVVSLAPEFFGVAPEKLARMNNPRALFDRGFAEWTGRRKADWARWLVAAYNRVLLRAPFRPGVRSAGGFSEPAAERADLLWGNAGWAVAALAAGSVARTGWPANLTGPRDGLLEDLPLGSGPDDAQVGPVEAALPEDCLEDLAEQGVAALTGREGSDAALLLRAPVLRRLDPGEPRVHGQLGYQLLAARLGAAVLARREALVAAGGGSEQALAGFQAYLEALLADTGAGAGAVVQGMADPEEPERLLVGVTARTGRAVLGGVEVHLGVRV